VDHFVHQHDVVRRLEIWTLLLCARQHRRSGI
jgi:hypothetical protein